MISTIGGDFLQFDEIWAYIFITAVFHTESVCDSAKLLEAYSFI